MKEFKKAATRIFIGSELILVAFLYLVSGGGIRALQHAGAQNSLLLDEIKHLESEIGSLTRELDERNNNPFYKESIARKELQMAYADEIIYVYPKG